MGANPCSQVPKSCAKPSKKSGGCLSSTIMVRILGSDVQQWHMGCNVWLATYFVQVSIYFFSCTAAVALRMAMLFCRSVHHFGADWNISTNNWWIAVKFCTDINGLQRMNPTDFGDLQSFPQVPQRGWHLWFSVKCLDIFWMDCHEIWLDTVFPSGWIVITLVWFDPLTFHVKPAYFGLLCVYC